MKQDFTHAAALQKELAALEAQITPDLNKYVKDFVGRKHTVDRVTFEDEQITFVSSGNSFGDWSEESSSLPYSFFDDPDQYIADEKKRNEAAKEARRIQNALIEEERERKQFLALKEKFGNTLI